MLESCYFEGLSTQVELDGIIDFCCRIIHFFVDSFVEYDVNLDTMMAVHTKTRYRFPVRRTGGEQRNDLKSEQKKKLLADEGVSISNDRKLAFMKIIFSKLEPKFIERMWFK